MHITMITPECAPIAKMGGLGDVVYGLGKDQQSRGAKVEIILPKYDCLRYNLLENLTETVTGLNVPWNGGSICCSVWTASINGLPVKLIDPHSQELFFNRGTVYGCNDDIMRFAFFCKAALSYILSTKKYPDVIHCHDWTTGLVPVLLYDMFAQQGLTTSRVCYTIHNFKHQGVAGSSLLHATGLGHPENYLRPEQMLDMHMPDSLNLMKAGIVYSNYVTTVSPQHAWEAQYTGQGFGLGPVLKYHHAKFEGILNGIDYATWNPKTDPVIPFRYDISSIDTKYDNKKALRKRLNLNEGLKPIVCSVGRLDSQKGIPLLHHALTYSLSHGAQFILLGSGVDPKINKEFETLKHRYVNNRDCHLELTYNEELSHLFYAGADMLVVPSLFEPCGLTQMIALKYGNVPVVRAVGGLANTVFDRDFSDKPEAQRNGFTFNDTDNKALESALSRAFRLWYDNPEGFRNLIVNGMNGDFSWAASGKQYNRIYEMLAIR
jgi:starch synthase